MPSRLILLGLPQWLTLARSVNACLILCAASFAVVPERVQANVNIDEGLLEELEERLTKPANCLPNCASIEKVALHADQNNLNIKMYLHAFETIAYPLPIQGSAWAPNKITNNGKPATLKRNDSGIWFVLLAKGNHVVDIHGNVAHVDSLNIRFSSNVHNLGTQVTHWRVTGLENGVLKGNTLLMQRVNPSAAAAKEKLLPDPMPAFVTVTRRLELGLDWRVTTTVERVTPALGAINLQVPLLPSESPVHELSIKDNTVNVNFSPNQRDVVWHSLLEKSDALNLVAVKNKPWVEVWRLSSSTLWHTEFTGIPVLKQGNNAEPVWRPWPGELLTINVTRPEAINGQQLTIENVTAEHTLGLRSNKSDLSIKVRSGKGGELPFTLPEGAKLQALKVNGIDRPLPHKNGELKIPLQPGEQTIKLRWQSEEGIVAMAKTPVIHLGQKSHNNRITLKLPHDRWPLLVGGPAIGPAVLLWGMLIVIIAISIGLGRIQGMPLKTYEWILLGIGLGTANVYAPLVIVVWLLLLTKRGEINEMPSRGKHQIMQIGLIVLSLTALGVLFGAVPHGLLSSPNMHISGNGSYAYDLHWYQDVTAEQMPVAWVLSLPMWAYRVTMLAWSLWLAFALLNWVKWAWAQLSYKGFWTEPKKKKSKETSLKNDNEEKPEDINKT